MTDTGKRRYRRFRVENMNINARTLFAADTELLNISMAGACIRAEQSLMKACKPLMKLNSENTPLTIPCSVVWENIIGDMAEATKKAYRAGVSFRGLPPYKLVRLKDFIRKSGSPYEQKVSDAYKPSLLRFQVHTNKQTVMYYTKTLPVKKIGLGGMLIELHCDIHIGKVFPMELFIPDENFPIKFHGKIASCIPAPGKTSGLFDIGIEFLDISTLDRFRLSKFLLFSKIPADK
jgi:hypothetical protein